MSTDFRRAERLQGLELSEIVQVSEAARAMRDAGHDVIALSTGEPDFPTPPHVVEAAHRAALHYCRALARRFPARADTPGLLCELRRFYRAAPEQKLRGRL